ncbi:MAG: hypothetical protein JWQ96_3311 [Segetibacter sp.]|nr:hypothetical protein [Segetibacter sp.]
MISKVRWMKIAKPVQHLKLPFNLYIYIYDETERKETGIEVKIFACFHRNKVKKISIEGIVEARTIAL